MNEISDPSSTLGRSTNWYHKRTYTLWNKWWMVGFSYKNSI